MNFILSPETFWVKELFNPPLKETGRYFYYTLEKSGVSHSQAVKRIGSEMQIKPKLWFCGTENYSSNLRQAKPRMWFCGVKDKNASTTQWFCTEEKIPETIEAGFRVKYCGASDTRIHVGVHKGNAFRVAVEMDEKEAGVLRHFKAKDEPVCNYFGPQRFGGTKIEFCGALAKGSYENALKVFLTRESKFDTSRSSRMKKIIGENWGEWKKIAENGEIAGTGKAGLFEFLSQNPKDFEGAFMYAEPRSLRIMLKSCQSMRFNEALNMLAMEKKPNNFFGSLAEGCPKYALGASKAFTRKIAVSPTPFEAQFRKSALERKTFFYAEKFKAKKLAGGKYELSFELPRGCYATVFLRFLEKRLSVRINKGFRPN